MAESAVRKALKLGQPPLVVGDLAGDVVLAQRERIADIGAEGLSGTRSGRLKGGPLLCADANRDGWHLDLSGRSPGSLGGSECFAPVREWPSDPLASVRVDHVVAAGVAARDGVGVLGGLHKTSVAHLSYSVKDSPANSLPLGSN